jgi:hypothetical protein
MDYVNKNVVGTCKVCGINLWKQHNGKPAIVCGLTQCPFPGAEIVPFPKQIKG